MEWFVFILWVSVMMLWFKEVMRGDQQAQIEELTARLDKLEKGEQNE